MSFADYTSLKTAVVTDWMHRGDLTSQADDFVDLFESEFNSTMRVRQMEQQTSIAATAGYILHPTNWLGWKRLTATSGGNTYALEPVSDEAALKLNYGESGGSTPGFYKVTGSKTYLFPENSVVTVSATYYEGVALSSGTNWLLTAYPVAYLFGSLKQAKLFANEEFPERWEAQYLGALDRIRQDSKRGEWSGQALRMNPDIKVV